MRGEVSFEFSFQGKQGDEASSKLSFQGEAGGQVSSEPSFQGEMGVKFWTKFSMENLGVE